MPGSLLRQIDGEDKREEERVDHRRVDEALGDEIDGVGGEGHQQHRENGQQRRRQRNPAHAQQHREAEGPQRKHAEACQRGEARKMRFRRAQAAEGIQPGIDDQPEHGHALKPADVRNAVLRGGKRHARGAKNHGHGRGIQAQPGKQHEQGFQRRPEDRMRGRAVQRCLDHQHQKEQRRRGNIALIQRERRAQQQRRGEKAEAPARTQKDARRRQQEGEHVHVHPGDIGAAGERERGVGREHGAGERDGERGFELEQAHDQADGRADIQAGEHADQKRSGNVAAQLPVQGLEEPAEGDLGEAVVALVDEQRVVRKADGGEAVDMRGKKNSAASRNTRTTVRRSRRRRLSKEISPSDRWDDSLYMPEERK